VPIALWGFLGVIVLGIVFDVFFNSLYRLTT
jgi:hypothetical protein